MKHSKSSVRRKFSHKLQLRFDDQRLTSFAGLLIFHQLFYDLDLRKRITRCFAHQSDRKSFSSSSIVLLLIVGVLLGYRRLRDISYFKDDPMTLRILGVSFMPSVSTVSRHLSSLDDGCVRKFQCLQQQMVIEAIVREQLSRVTMDFDGSVLGTCRSPKALLVASIVKRKASAAIIHSFAHWLKPLKCSRYCTEAVTYTIAMVLNRSFVIVLNLCEKRCQTPLSKPAWIALSLAKN